MQLHSAPGRHALAHGTGLVPPSVLHSLGALRSQHLLPPGAVIPLTPKIALLLMHPPQSTRIIQFRLWRRRQLWAGREGRTCR